MNKFLYFIFNAFSLTINLNKEKSQEYDLAIQKENIVFKITSYSYEMILQVISMYKFKSDQQQIIKQRLSIVNVLWIAVFVLSSIKMNAQDTIPNYYCKEPVDGNAFDWSYGNNYSGTTVSETITQPGTNAGYQFDIYGLDNSFNMEINGVSLAQYEIEFQSSGTSGINIEFQDGDQYEADTPAIWQMTGTPENPIIRVVISPSGEVSMFGSKQSGGPLFPLRFKQSFSPVNSFNTIPWNTDSDNTIIVTQNVVGPTGIDGYGYGQNYVSCDTYTLEKEGVFNDENNDGIAQVGETITYTISLTNLGDIDIYNVAVNDPMLGGEITSAYTGDTNNDGVLNIDEVWEYQVSYTITQSDINNGGVYNQAFVTGETSSGDTFETEYSVDPNPLDPSDPNYDPSRPNHTFTLLRGRTLLITNPNIYHRVKNK